MNITILALGSRGDVLPFATLGKRLQIAGHRVCIATFENFAPMIAAHDVDFQAVSGDSEKILRAASGMALAESGQNVIRMWLTVMRSFGVMARGFARDYDHG